MSSFPGRRGDQRPPDNYAPPPASTPRPVPPRSPATSMSMLHRAAMALPHQAAYAAPAAGPLPGVRSSSPQPPHVSAPAAPPVAALAKVALGKLLLPRNALAPVATTTTAASASPAPDANPAPQPSSSAPDRHQLAVPDAPVFSAPSSAAGLEGEVPETKMPFLPEMALPPVAEAAPLDLAPLSKQRLPRPARPDLGTKAMVRAKEFLDELASNNFLLYHYDVSINPEPKSRAINRKVVRELIGLHGKTELGSKLCAYDGRSLYIAGPFPFSSKEFVVTLVDPEKEEERAKTDHKIRIQISGRTDLYHLKHFLCGKQRETLLDIMLSPVTLSRSCLYTTFGREGGIGGGLESYKDYYRSMHPQQMGSAPHIDAFATSFSKLVTMLRFVEEFLSLCDTSPLLSSRNHVRDGIDLKPKSGRALSEKKRSRETKRKLLNELVKLQLKTSLHKDSTFHPFGSGELEKKDRESQITFGIRKVLKKVAARLARNFKKFRGKMVTSHLNKFIEKIHARLARKLSKVNCQQNVAPSSPPSILRPSKELAVQCPRISTATVESEGEHEYYFDAANFIKDPCWQYPSSIPEVVICRPVEVRFYRTLDEVLGDVVSLFDYVKLPLNRRKPAMKDDFVSFLNGFSRYVIHALLVCVCREGHEVRQICWGGSFGLKDIWISEGHLKINPNLDFQHYNHDDARKDYEQLHYLIHSTFRDPVIEGHPCLLDNLLRLLQSCPDQIRQNHDFITFLTNHPCLMSCADRLKIYFVLEKMIAKLPWPHSVVLDDILNNQQHAGWASQIFDVIELKDAYSRGVYGMGLGEAFRFVRNFLNHTRATVTNLIEAEASVSFFLPFLLHTALLTLVLTFTGPPGWDLMGLISNTNADRSEAQFARDWVHQWENVEMVQEA